MRAAWPASSVLVPAHEEETVIVRCLDAVLADVAPGAVDLHVVVNGSRDATAAVVRAWAAASGHPVDLLVLPSAGKSAALRAGASRCARGVLVCLDADVEMAPEVLRHLVDALQAPGPRVASPELHVRTAGSHRAVRAYYRVWTQLPYTRAGMVGSGVYALSADAAVVLVGLPDVTNDDGYVQRSFPAAQRLTTPGAFTITAPVTAAALCARRARIHNGNLELVGRGLPAADTTTAPGLVALVRARRVGRLDAGVYVLLTVAARVLARWRRLRGHGLEWSTDLTTRRGVPR